MHFHWTSGGWIMSYSHRLKRIWSFPIFLGVGAAFVKPRKGFPEMSYSPLRIVKLSLFIQCILQTTCMHSCWTSGGWIMSYSHRLKRIWSFPIFLGGGAAFVKPKKGFPEMSYYPEDGQNIIIHPTSWEGFCQRSIWVLSVSWFCTFLSVHYATLPFCHSTIPPFCHSAIPPFHHSAILPFRHSLILPFRHSAISPFRHFTIPPFRSNMQ